jgi:hypothetical protein
MSATKLARVEEILRSLPGVVEVARLDGGKRWRAIDLESAYEVSSVLPVRNLGVKLLASRDHCYAILKDGRFRAPKSPTVYLVEQDIRGDAAHSLEVEGVRYAVVGEEVVEGHADYAEPVIPLESSFVMFPERRSGPGVPCSFMLPPLPFPELEREAAALGISGIISISPSLAADGFIRDTFHFPVANALATLLVGFNSTPPGPSISES